MATDLPGILIVDDNEDNRYTLQLMLETDGHERIASAAGGNEAIALIEKEKLMLPPSVQTHHSSRCWRHRTSEEVVRWNASLRLASVCAAACCV